MAEATLDYNSINWRELLYYDETSESCLRWKINPQWNKKFKGRCVGYKKVRKSIGQPIGWVLRYRGKNYQLHRVLYIIMTDKYLPNNFVIDHKNGDCFDNRFENLQLVSETINARNKKKYITNSSGVTGIRLHYTKGGALAYIAIWVDSSGKLCSKTFNTVKYGQDALQLAIAYRLNQIQKLGYSDRHKEHSLNEKRDSITT